MKKQESPSPTRNDGRRILLAAYHFPPSAAVGGLRATRFARFLPEFGWAPYVLTVNDADRDPDEGIDRTRLAGLEEIPVTRTHAPAGIITLYARLKARLRRRSGREGQPPIRVAVPLSVEASRQGETLAQRVKRYIASIFVLLPDEQKNWSLFAAATAVRLIRTHHINWVLTSGPPFSVHFIGLAAKLFTNVKWVADFRDPWLEMLPERPPNSRSWLSDRIERWMEARVMRGADIVLTTTERMRASIASRYRELPGEKFVCLPNGIDARQSPSGHSVEKYCPLTITYAGTLYLDRTPEPVFRAFGELLRERIATLADFRIKLVGSCRQIGGLETEEVARQYGVEASVEIIDRVPHAEAIQIMQKSHLLLVLAPPNHQLVLPAKIFDYLGSGSRILALAEPGATTDLMIETGGGSCFSQTDISGLKEYFNSLLLLDGHYRNLRNEPDSFVRYHARNVTGQLAAALSDSHAPPKGMAVRP